jgi:hypothetical protein
MSKKGIEWNEFSDEVEKHINTYVVPQYGDYPDEMIEGFTEQDVKRELERYIRRIGSNSRGVTEALRDAKKIAHYACFLHTKLKARSTSEVKTDEQTHINDTHT